MLIGLEGILLGASGGSRVLLGYYIGPCRVFSSFLEGSSVLL